jgi:hypothetical protein
VVYSFTEAGFRILFPVWILFLLAIMADLSRRKSDPELELFDTTDTIHDEGQADDFCELERPLVGQSLSGTFTDSLAFVQPPLAASSSIILQPDHSN